MERKWCPLSSLQGWGWNWRRNIAPVLISPHKEVCQKLKYLYRIAVVAPVLENPSGIHPRCHSWKWTQLEKILRQPSVLQEEFNRQQGTWECEGEVNKWYCVLSQTDQQPCIEAVQGNLTSNLLTLVTYKINEIAQFSLHGEPSPEESLHNRYCALGMQNEGNSNNGQDSGNPNHSIPSLVWGTVSSEKDLIGDSLLWGTKATISHPDFSLEEFTAYQ